MRVYFSEINKRENGEMMKKITPLVYKIDRGIKNVSMLLLDKYEDSIDFDQKNINSDLELEKCLDKILDFYYPLKNKNIWQQLNILYEDIENLKKFLM